MEHILQTAKSIRPVLHRAVVEWHEVVRGMPVQTTSGVRSALMSGPTNLLITQGFGVFSLFHSAVQGHWLNDT